LKYQLRPYQQKGDEQLRESLLKGNRRIIYWLATGGGKGLVMAYMVNQALLKGKKVLTVMRRRELIFQTRKNYAKYYNIDPSIIMGNEKGFDSKNPVQICSIDTVRARLGSLDFLKQFDLVIVDECFPKNHYIETSEGNKTFGFLYQQIKKGEKLPLALSYNEKTKTFEYKKILNVFKNSPKKEIMEIKAGPYKINPTKNHKILTSEGYKQARHIKKGDAIVFNKKTSKNISPLNSVQKSVFVGSFFGDGSIHNVSKNCFRLRVVHNEKTQGEYCKFKSDIFSAKTTRVKNQGYSKNWQTRFNTKCFYIKTDDFFDYAIKNMDLIGLAIFAMDDGSKSINNNGFRFHTENFNKEQNIKISKMLFDKFGIISSVKKYKKRYFFLYLNKENYEKLSLLLKNFIHKDLKYKFLNTSKKLDIKKGPKLNYFYGVVSSVKKITSNEKNLFDVEVEQNHNYIVKKTRSAAGVVVHNCHDTTSPSYNKLFNFLGNKIYIGFTATPFRVGNKVHDFWDDYIYPISPRELMEQGYLVPARVYAPKKMDLTGIRKVSTGDYNNKQLFQMASDSRIVGDIVETWQKYGKGKTVLFAVNIAHSILMAHAFNSAGIKAIHIDQSHSRDERQDAINKLENGEIDILCNVNIFSTGIDIPSISTLILARPTTSEILYIQQIGRGLRIAPGKTECIVLDHAGNSVDRFGLPFDERTPELNEEQKKKKENSTMKQVAKSCESCFAILEMNFSECPYCGAVLKKEREIKTESGELQELTETPRHLLFEKYKSKLDQLSNIQKIKNFKPNWKYFKLYELFGDDIYKFEKELGLPNWIPKFAKREQDKSLSSTSKTLKGNSFRTSKSIP
jgi:superfamily II DNA or RNA helicase